VEGSTENATVVRRLVTDLRDRGVDAAGGILFVLDGGKALRRAETPKYSLALEVFGAAVACKANYLRGCWRRQRQRSMTCQASRPPRTAAGKTQRASPPSTLILGNSSGHAVRSTRPCWLVKARE
jgi:hypothetical protein